MSFDVYRDTDLDRFEYADSLSTTHYLCSLFFSAGVRIA